MAMMDKVRIITTILVIIAIFSSFGCSNSSVKEAYKHLKMAREYYSPGVTYIKKDYELALVEYEKALSISKREFEPLDYYTMADLYLKVRNDSQKHDEFIKKGDELKKKTGNTGLGSTLIRMLSFE